MRDEPGAIAMFSSAMRYVQDAQLLSEIEWQRAVSIDQCTESDFLREAAWVVLCSGFRESTVRQVFDYISLCFCDWESSEAIALCAEACVSAAQMRFGHRGKLEAIVSIAINIREVGFEVFKEELTDDPISKLQQLPFIGPITSYHLAKNIGVDISKPDRHLIRASRSLGFDCSKAFCSYIAECVDEPARVVDLVIWRYLADNSSAGKLPSPFATN